MRKLRTAVLELCVPVVLVAGFVAWGNAQDPECDRVCRASQQAERDSYAQAWQQAQRQAMVAQQACQQARAQQQAILLRAGVPEGQIITTEC